MILKKIGIAILSLAISMAGCTGQKQSRQVCVVDSKELTYEQIVTRTPDEVLVEKITGVVVSENKDGKILDADENADYISYRSVKGAKVEDIVITYCVYNPETQEFDDIIERYDFIVKKY